jgi:predicted membrane protein
MLVRPMPRIIINGEEIRSPLARFVLLVVGCVLGAIVLASAAAWALIFLGLGTVFVIVASVVALLLAAVFVPWAVVSALLRRGGGHRW